MRKIWNVFWMIGCVILLGTRILVDRPVCQIWNLEMNEATQKKHEAQRDFLLAENDYLSRARLNCVHDLDQTSRGNRRDPEKFMFCRSFTKNQIPSAWSMNADLCNAPDVKNAQKNRVAGMKLTCHAKKAKKAQYHFEKIKTDLTHKAAQRPSLCRRTQVIRDYQ